MGRNSLCAAYLGLCGLTKWWVEVWAGFGLSEGLSLLTVVLRSCPRGALIQPRLTRTL